MSCLLCAVSGVVLALAVLFKLYMKLTTGWCKSQTCLVGKTVIVTGANTGIGYDTALDFAKRGARVILACRDQKRAEEARAKIVEETGNENVVVRLVNMSSFSSVRAFAKKINETEDRLDILLNNAGIMGIGDVKSDDGHMLLMQTNHFSSFLLTVLLLGLLKKTKQSRVVNVSSLAGRLASNFDVKKINTFPGKLQQYNWSKLCNILFTIELAKKLKGTGVTTYSLHPGAIKTEISRHETGVLKLLIPFVQNVFFKSSEEGAQTSIYCSVAKGIEDYSGEHFEDCHRIEPYNTTKVPGLSKKLWEVTEEIVQLKPEEVSF